jgi:lysozyme
LKDKKGLNMPAETPDLEGIDVSSNQGPVNWAQVSNGSLSFAYLRATIGAHSADSQFAGNWMRIRSTALIRGTYHFFWPLVDAADQANNYVDTVGLLMPGDLPPVGELAGYPLWIAHCTVAHQPPVPSSWNDWTFRQYTDKGRVNGISRNVDDNRFNWN